MLANQFIRENPWRNYSQEEERIKDYYHCHNKVDLFGDAKLSILSEMTINFSSKIKKVYSIRMSMIFIHYDSMLITMLNNRMRLSNKMKVLLPFFIITITCGCDLIPEEKIPNTDLILGTDGKIIEGELTRFFDDGKIASVMNFKDRKLDGKAVKYYEDGKTKRSELFYVAGLLEGIQKRYYKSGKLYKEENYINDKREGLTTKYHESGTLMTEAIFKNGFPGIDLKEYLTDGRLKKNYPKIIIENDDQLRWTGKFIINISLSNKSKKVEFYLGELEDGIFLSDKLDRQYNVVDGVLSFTITLKPGETAQGDFDIVAKDITRMNNVHILVRKHRIKVVNPKS